LLHSERGFLATIVLMAIAVAVLMVTPFLAAASTNLNSSRIVNALALHQYSADSGIEHAMWRLKYEAGFSDSFSTESPSLEYSINVNGIDVPIRVTKVNPPLPLEESTDPESQPEGARLYVQKSVSPSVVESGVETFFTYTIFIENIGTAVVHLQEIGDLLPPSFSYVSLSSSGSTSTEPIVNIVNGQEELTWLFAAPNPKIETGETQTQSFQAVATLQDGTYYNKGWVVATPDSIGEISSGSTAPIQVGVKRFDIEATGGKVAIKANVKLNDSNELSVLSWQIE